MAYLAPAWLFALIPWGAFAAWLLVGRRKRQWVPFLDLWEAPEELRKPKKGFEPPPSALVFALLATLLGLLALARPTAFGPTPDRGRVTIVVDRGASMSAVVAGQPRFAHLADSAGPKLLEAFGAGSVDLIDPLDNLTEKTDRSTWPSLVARWKRTDADTRAALTATVQSLLRRGEPTIVLTDRDLGLGYDQLVQVKPENPVHDAGIVAIAARPAQVMIRVRGTHAVQRTVRLRSGDAEATRAVDLFPGREESVFIDFSPAANIIEVSLAEPDDCDANDRAWLVRHRPWPSVEARVPLSDELRRMLDVYTKHRPTSASSPRVAIARPGDVRPDEPTILLLSVVGPELPQVDLRTSPHPILAGVDLALLARGAAVAAGGPGEGWTVLARAGGKPLIAAHDGPPRQAWLGFDSRDFGRTPSFVVLWTNLLDWSGAAGEESMSGIVAAIPQGAKRVLPERLAPDIDSARWPGVFETATGPVARNPTPVTFSTGSADWVPALPRLRLSPGSGIDLTRWLALAALACLLFAALTWERQRGPAPRPPAHLDVESITRAQSTVAADGHVHQHQTTTGP